MTDSAEKHDHEKECLILLARWLCKATIDAQDAWTDSLSLPPDEFKDRMINKFPVVQTTRLQKTLRDVGLGIADIDEPGMLNEALRIVQSSVKDAA